jgi:hypothetical protein
MDCSDRDFDKMFGSLSIIDENDCFCLPPLDQVTTCSNTDDASSVSSMSTNAEDFEAPPRTIFKSFWTNNGSRSSFSQPSTPRSASKRRLPKELSHSEIYECSLSSPSFVEEKTSPTRRKIFGNSGSGCFSKSEPQLALSLLMSDSDRSFRKTRSSSALPGQPKESCLRRGRYTSPNSSNSERRDRDSISSVSFSHGVNVVVFKQPMELYAPTGWSKWFV